MPVLLNEAELERSAARRVTLRLVPFLIVCYFIAFLDRVNVGFAALQMNKDLGFSATVFGWGAGFVGPFLIGAIKDATGSFTLGLLPLIAFAVVAGLVALAMGKQPYAAAAAE